MNATPISASVETESDPDAARQRRRVWWSSFLGSTVEYYDFNVYSTASALVFASLFFGDVDPALGLVLAFATFAIGFIGRPLGAAIFGHFGDRIGRKSVLLLSIWMMGVATVAIGLLPTFETVGVVAPLFLVVLRLVQGVAAGGEWGGGVVMTTEHSRSKFRAFMGSSTVLGVSAGYLLGAIAWAIVIPLTGDQFLVWGWRIPFLATVVLFAIGLYIRLRVEESPIMKEIKAKIDAGERGRAPIALVFTKHWRSTAMGALIFAGPFMVQTLATTFFLAYAVSNYGFTREEMVTAITIGVTVSTICIPFAGLLADRFGKPAVLRVGLIGAIVHAALLIPLWSVGEIGLVYLSFGILFFFHSMCIAPLGALYSEMFPSAVRFTGVAVTYQLASLVGAGFSPLIASGLIAAGMPVAAVMVMAIGFCVIALVLALRLRREKTAIDLREV